MEDNKEVKVTRQETKDKREGWEGVMPEYAGRGRFIHHSIMHSSIKIAIFKEKIHIALISFK